jgi:hypothetical protein
MKVNGVAVATDWVTVAKGPTGYEVEFASGAADRLMTREVEAGRSMKETDTLSDASI